MIEVFLLTYMAIAFLMALVSVVVIRNRLVKLGFWRLLLFFVTQPILALKEIIKMEKK
ncbi:MAG: hypothetical protein WC141_09360 [Arcobacteraceae bacterium]